MKSRVCQRCGTIVQGDCSCKPTSKASTNVNGYDRKWQRFRKKVMVLRARQGKLQCAKCGTGFGAVSPHADHIVPVMSQADPMFFTESNIQLLHPKCHGENTKQDVRRGLTR